MPLYKDRIAQELEKKKTDFEGSISEDVVEAYTEAAENISSDFSRKEVLDELQDEVYPGGLPTDEFDEYDGLVIPFETSSGWGSHEAVNQWARGILEDTTTVAADGSQIDPVTEFERPVGLVQAVWIANKHSAEGDYEEDAETIILTPDDLLFEDPNSGYIHVDEQEVPVTRFEVEMRMLENQVRKYGEDEDGEPPVVMYDGSLILSFMQMFDQKTQDRYAEALTRLLAASRRYKVPVIGYVSGSKATELGNLFRSLGLIDIPTAVRDYQFLADLMDNWGSRTQLFYSHRDQTQNRLQTTYQGRDYDFSDKILFTYLNIGPGSQIDRVELPAWIYQEDMTEYVLSIIRAEAGVGRGYPEILQSADTDAVISRKEREEFLRMFQAFSEENGFELQWNNKALSKKRRRR